jgi:hypothetical protein
MTSAMALRDMSLLMAQHTLAVTTQVNAFVALAGLGLNSEEIEDTQSHVLEMMETSVSLTSSMGQALLRLIEDAHAPRIQDVLDRIMQEPKQVTPPGLSSFLDVVELDAAANVIRDMGGRLEEDEEEEGDADE